LGISEEDRKDVEMPVANNKGLKGFPTIDVTTLGEVNKFLSFLVATLGANFGLLPLIPSSGGLR